jgi:hypothetical protein
VFAGLVQGDEMRFLFHAQGGGLASQPALGLGDLHTLAGSDPGQVRLELGDSSPRCRPDASGSGEPEWLDWMRSGAAPPESGVS